MRKAKIYHHLKSHASECTLIVGMLLLQTFNWYGSALLSWNGLLFSVMFTGFAAWTVYVRRRSLVALLGVTALISFVSALLHLPLSQTPSLLLHAGIAVIFSYLMRRLLESRDKIAEVSREMEHLAYHDALTGLPNRRLFEDRLQHALVRAKRSGQLAAVLFLDLDQFKKVNDTLGHICGDTLIRIMGERLQSCLREGDTVYRQSGDEFTLLLEDISKPEDVRLVASRIHDALEVPYEIDGHLNYVTASVGIALYPTDGETPDELIKHADTAMYGAKERGRNNYQFFTPGLDALLASKQELETGLRYALDRGEMELRYQPQYALSTKQIIGMEAVLQWKRPGRGVLHNNEWLSIAEETGLLVPIGEWTLFKACLQAKRWQDEGRRALKLSVGLSVAQFKKENLVDRIAEILEETGLDPKYIELDLAEGVSMLSVQMVSEKLRLLKRLGVRITMDDVCAGLFTRSQSSLVPMDTIKLDSTLIRDLAEDRENQTLAEAITAMAQRLQLSLIAKGVDTQEQLDQLHSLHCQEGQGEFFSGPLIEKDFEELLQQQAG